MRQPPTNICPLMAIADTRASSGPSVCIMDRCAWWDCYANECAAVSAAESLAAIAAGLTERKEGVDGR